MTSAFQRLFNCLRVLSALLLVTSFASAPADAANVTKTTDVASNRLDGQRASRVSASGVRSKRAATVPNLHPAIAGCQTVAISAFVEGDLEEPTQTATAAYVIDSPGKYSGLNVDGTGCDIGIYIATGTKNVSISDSVVHDATRAGIVADTTCNTILFGNTVYDIGSHVGPLYEPNGVQYGFAVLADTVTKVAIDYVSVYLFQKEGFLVIDSSGSVNLNSATGAGMIDYIASNGFEIDGSNLDSIFGNRTELNQYTGPYYGAAGYILCGTSVQHHLLTSSSRFEKQFAEFWQNLSAFDDIPYYIDGNADCS
jgi:hypothetical protein